MNQQQHNIAYNSEKAIEYLSSRIATLEKSVAVYIGALIEKDRIIAEKNKQIDELQPKEPVKDTE